MGGPQVELIIYNDMRPSVVLPEIARRKPQRESQGTDQKKDQLIRIFEQKLQIHEQEIEKNNTVINSMTNNFDIIRGELMKEKSMSEELAALTKRQKEEMDRLQKTSKSSRVKLDEIQRLYAIEANNNKELNSLMDGFKDRERDQCYDDNRNKKLEQQNFSLSRVNHQLTKEVEQLKSSYSEKLEQQDRVSQMVEKYLKEMKQLKEDRNRLNAQNEHYEHRIQLLSQDHQRQIQHLETENRTLKNGGKDLQKLASSKLVVQKAKYQQELQSLKKQLLDTKSSFQKSICQLQTELANLLKGSDQRIKQLEQQLKKTKESQTREDQTNKSTMQTFKSKLQKLQQITKMSSKLEQGQKLMVQSLQCQFCKNQMKEPVTIIPCGHCFCLGCKKGYQKECCQCGPKVKVDALYRNQLLDDVLGIYCVVREIRQLLRS